MKLARILAATMICVMVLGLLGVQAETTKIKVNAIQGEGEYAKITKIDLEKKSITFENNKKISKEYKWAELMDVKLAEAAFSPVDFSKRAAAPNSKYRIIFRNGNHVIGNILSGKVIGTDLYLEVNLETSNTPALYLAGTVAAVQNLSPEAYRLIALNDYVNEALRTPFGKILFHKDLCTANRLKEIYANKDTRKDFNEHAKVMLEEKTAKILERINTRKKHDYYYNMKHKKTDAKEYRGMVVDIFTKESELKVTFKDSLTKTSITNNLDQILGLSFKSNAIGTPKGFGTSQYIKILTRKGSILTGKIVGSTDNAFTIETDIDTKDPQGTTTPLRFEVLFNTIANIEFYNGNFEYLSDIADALITTQEEYGDIEPATGPSSKYQFGMRRDHSTEWVRKSDDLPPIKINGKVYKKGLGTHSYNKLTFNIGSRFSAFKAIVGFNDTFDGTPNTIGNVDIKILCDGTEVLSLLDFKPGDKRSKIDIPLTGVNELTLIIDFGKNGNRMDRISWGNAILVKGVTAKPTNK